MPKYLGKAEIFGAKDVTCEEVEVPEWGGVVRVKAMTAAEKDAFEASLVIVQQLKNGMMVRKPNNANVRAKLAAKSIVDEEGNLIFDDGDILELGEKSAIALDRVVDVASKLSRISAADIKELSKDLKNDPPAASLSD